ncbi:MAG: glycosyltransferase family 2 protein [Infirmifilum sp.]
MSASSVLAEKPSLSKLLSVSIIIPSYHGNERLVRLVQMLSEASYPSFEVIVVVDEPLEPVAENLLKFKGDRIRVILNAARSGKVNALNNALKHARGDVIIFLDDDVEISDPLFIQKIVEAIKDYDIADIKKVVVAENLLGKMVYIEYVATNFASKLMARFAGKTIAINGAAFAMKRKALEEIGFFKPIISEDFDLAIRSFLRGHKFTYIESTFVYNYPPESWRRWYRQRKRWAIGLADWVQRYFFVGLKAVLEMPHVLIPGLLISLPSLVSTLLPFFLYNHTLVKSLYLFLLSLSSLISQVIPFTALLSVNLQIIYFIPLTLALTFFMVWHFMASKYIRMKSYAYLYPLYFLVYQPLWLTILIAGFIRTFLMKKMDLEDWVV